MSRRLPAVAATAILAAGAVPALAAAKPAPRVLLAPLVGKSEVSPTGARGVGDPDARGGATVFQSGGRLCFGIVLAKTTTPIAAHIHRGRRGVAGPIVVPLATPLPSGSYSAYGGSDLFASAGCATVRPALQRAILRHPARYYVNVHTRQFPDGAARGQLRRGR